MTPTQLVPNKNIFFVINLFIFHSFFKQIFYLFIIFSIMLTSTLIFIKLIIYYVVFANISFIYIASHYWIFLIDKLKRNHKNYKIGFLYAHYQYLKK
jgi:hypothetical protein